MKHQDFDARITTVLTAIDDDIQVSDEFYDKIEHGARLVLRDRELAALAERQPSQLAETTLAQRIVSDMHDVRSRNRSPLEKFGSAVKGMMAGQGAVIQSFAMANLLVLVVGFGSGFFLNNRLSTTVPEGDFAFMPQQPAQAQPVAVETADPVQNPEVRKVASNDINHDFFHLYQRVGSDWSLVQTSYSE